MRWWRLGILAPPTQVADPQLEDDTAEVLAAVSAQIRRLRTEAGLTQEQLAGATGIDYKRIQRIEAGAVNLTVHTLVRIAASLDVSVSEFFQD